MTKSTQAHMSQSWHKNRPLDWKNMKKKQMEYYMGAKLIEVGVNPKSAIYRWSMSTDNDQETWTYSAFWGDSKDKLSE